MNRLTDSQRKALNQARGRAMQVRQMIESLDKRDIETGGHLAVSVEVTNLIHELEKALKA